MEVERKETLRDLAGKENLILQLLQESEDWEEGPDGGGAAKKVLEDLLAATTADRKEKVDRTYYAMRSLEAKEDALRAEEKHLAEMRQTARNQAERLKGYLRLIAQEQGVAKGDSVRFRGETHSITVSESGFSVHVDCKPRDLAFEFREHIPATWKAVKKRLAAHIKAGGEVPEGVRTEPTIMVRFR